MEANTEGSQELTNVVAESFARHGYDDIDNVMKDITSEESVNRILESAKAGAQVGLGFGTAGATTTSAFKALSPERKIINKEAMVQGEQDFKETRDAMGAILASKDLQKMGDKARELKAFHQKSPKEFLEWVTSISSEDTIYRIKPDDIKKIAESKGMQVNELLFTLTKNEKRRRENQQAMAEGREIQVSQLDYNLNVFGSPLIEMNDALSEVVRVGEANVNAQEGRDYIKESDKRVQDEMKYWEEIRGKSNIDIEKDIDLIIDQLKAFEGRTGLTTKGKRSRQRIKPKA